MKIVCEACQAKYSISDDKVRGKVFKIRCKKCSHIIVVRGNEGAGADSDADGAPQPEAAAAPGNDAQWYVVIDGEQVGPLTASDVGGRVSRGEVSPESYAWREGMADWLQLSAITEFSGIVDSAPAGTNGFGAGGQAPDDDDPFGAQPPTAVMPPGQAEDILRRGAMGRDAEPQGDDPFGGGATVVGSPPEAGGLFASAKAPLSSGNGGEDLFTSAPTRAASPGYSSPSSGGGSMFPPAAQAVVPAAAMTGQRSENSVLFSLSNLEALAGPAPSASPMMGMGGGGGMSGGFGSPITGGPAPEGSGLIDIRSMAALSLGPSSAHSSYDPSPSQSLAGDFPSFQAAPMSPVAAPLLGMHHHQSSGMPKWVVGLIVGAVVLVLVVGGLLIKVISDSKPVPAEGESGEGAAATAPIAAAPAVTPPTSRTQEPAAETAPPPVEAVAAAPAEGAEAPAAEEPATKSKTKATKRPARPSSSPTTASKPTGAAADPTPAPTPAAAPAPKKKGDALDDLLSGAISGGGKSRPTAAAATPEAPAKKLGPLSKSDIVKTMKEADGRTSACYQKYKSPGLVNVTIKVEDSGKVSSASAGGKFKGTPSGDCVEAAIKSLRFPASDAGMTFPYPISLR